LVSVSDTLVSPSMLRIVLRRYLPLYLGFLSADIAAERLLLLPPPIAGVSAASRLSVKNKNGRLTSEGRCAGSCRSRSG